MKLIHLTREVWSIHKDQPKEIALLLFSNALYAFAGMSVPTLISLEHDIGVFISMGFYYGLLVKLFTRPKYETRTGRFYFWLSLLIGGFCGYKFAPLLITFW